MKKTKSKILFLVLILFLFSITPVYARGNTDNASDSGADKNSAFDALGSSMNNAFYFVVDKIIDLQGYFIWYAKGVGRVVFLIALLSAALNYALTGAGLKENLIKIFKATVFFMIVINWYPTIISYITKMTFEMANNSVGESISEYFQNSTREVQQQIKNTESVSAGFHSQGEEVFHVRTTYETFISQIQLDSDNLFSNISVSRKHPRMGEYTTVAPANLLKVIFFIAEDLISYADNKTRWTGFPEFSAVLKGLICAGFVVATGCFALLEYLVCFLEFMLATSVGVILFPLSIWEGSKFMSEKFIGAIVGFFIKMLFCNIAIFLLLYGFISLFYTFAAGSNGFTGKADQILFIIFVCLLFFYICKSAPALASSLLTGTPNLSGTGAISAAAGAVGGAVAATNFASKAVKAGGSLVGGGIKTGINVGGSIAAADAASNTVAQGGGGRTQQFGAFMTSLGSDAGASVKAGAYGFTQRLLGNKNSNIGSSPSSAGDNPYNSKINFSDSLNRGKKFGEFFDDRKQQGSDHGKNYKDA